jgi:hypothetical protein
LKKIDHNIGFREKRQFFRRKLGKIVENCDHNIDPSLGLKRVVQIEREKKLVPYILEGVFAKSSCSLNLQIGTLTRVQNGPIVSAN